MAESASDEAYLEIRKRILGGKYTPGSFLSNQGLAVEFSLSRTPVRDALRRLETDGLVVIVPRSGANVREFTAEEIIDLDILRTSLEPSIASVAAERCQPSDLVSMRACNERLARWYSNLSKQPKPNYGNDNQLIYLDYQFHASIAKAARSLVLSDVFNRLQISVTLFHHTPRKGLSFPAHSLPSSAQEVIDQHEAIASAIEKRDPELARKAMEDHLSGLMAASREWLHQVATSPDMD